MKITVNVAKEIEKAQNELDDCIVSLSVLVNARNSRIVDLTKINKEHQKLKGELREDNKKLSRQIDDYVNKLRKAGLI